MKKKLCWNCEGSVARTLETCPFCGVYLNPAESESDDGAESSIFGEKSDRAIPKAPYLPEEPAQELEDVASESKADKGAIKAIYSLLLILAGSVYGFFGLVVFFFSKGGTFTLSWAFEWSYVFLALSLPLLALGFLQLRDLD